MHEDDFRSIEAGATVVTAGRRLARALTQQFHSLQQARARAAWKTPDILPLDAFLVRVWRDWVLSGEMTDTPVLLDALQEQLLWEQVIGESPQGDSLLRIPETARRAMDAWRLAQAYRLPVDGRYEATEEWSAFAGWAQAFQKRCRLNRWLEQARLMDAVAPRLRAAAAARPQRICRAGFDELTPQQSEFFDTLGEWREFRAPDFAPAPQHRAFPNAAQEIRAAAAWARRLLENAPEAQIGVIVPNLTSLRAKVERIFRETLDPGTELDDREGSFHLSLGPALHDYPLIRTALLMLEFGLGPLTLPLAGMLLRSPFLAGSEEEGSKRALLDAGLRREGVWQVTAASLRLAAGSCPLLQRALRRFEKAVAQMAVEQRASEWAGAFSKLLEALGWPGGRSLTSREHQVLEAWRGLLSSLAALDVASPPMNLAQAMARLIEIARATPFQVENQGARVQIMGLLEASGLHFDHLWMMGLDDEALPAAANPNPFLPLSLQRESGLPHASAERELEFANRLLGRLLASAPEVVLSYAETEGDRVLAPTPLITGLWEQAMVDLRSNDWIARMRAGVSLEELADETAPPRPVDFGQTGGASLFKDMSACPFRAFAKHRLDARPLEDCEPGLSYRERGSIVHKALELIWAELGSHARLMELGPADLGALIARHVEAAVGRLGEKIGRRLEQRRLQNLLAEWLELEKSRAAFTVLKPEEERAATIGDLAIRTRVDRIDAIDGGEIILDYKTGQVRPGGWDSARPDEPQLPLYCIASKRPITGAAFASIRAGELGFRGLTDHESALPAMKKMYMTRSMSFSEHVGEWRRVLEQLARDFSAGVAPVDPKPGACEHCGLAALCRIRELDHDRG